MPGVGEKTVSFQISASASGRIVACCDSLSAPVKQIYNQLQGATRGTKSAVPTWKSKKKKKSIK